jgi:hypothetical protein
MKEETTMLKSISAALLAVSVLAAPALAAGSAKTTQAPVIKAEQVKKPTVKAAQVKQVKPSVLNANAKMSHHRKHFRHHAHQRMGALKTHPFSKVTTKHVISATKRG